MPFPPYLESGVQVRLTLKGSPAGESLSFRVLDVYAGRRMISYVGPDGPVVVSDEDVESLTVVIDPDDSGMISRVASHSRVVAGPEPAGRWKRKMPRPRPKGGVLVELGKKPVVGRNDPCQCGSGRKSKRCCHGKG